VEQKWAGMGYLLRGMRGIQGKYLPSGVTSIDGDAWLLKKSRLKR
jgi:hypothetical protein